MKNSKNQRQIIKKVLQNIYISRRKKNKNNHTQLLLKASQNEREREKEKETRPSRLACAVIAKVSASRRDITSNEKGYIQMDTPQSAAWRMEFRLSNVPLANTRANTRAHMYTQHFPTARTLPILKYRPHDSQELCDRRLKFAPRRYRKKPPCLLPLLRPFSLLHRESDVYAMGALRIITRAAPAPPSLVTLAVVIKAARPRQLALII